MVKKATDERRTSIRANRVLNIEYKLLKSTRKTTDKNAYLSTTYDMSLGGVAFYSDTEYSKGDLLSIQIVMSGVLDVFKGHAQVVRVENKKSKGIYLIAVQFLDESKLKRSAKKYNVAKRKGSKATKKRV